MRGFHRLCFPTLAGQLGNERAVRSAHREEGCMLEDRNGPRGWGPMLGVPFAIHLATSGPNVCGMNHTEFITMSVVAIERPWVFMHLHIC